MHSSTDASAHNNRTAERATTTLQPQEEDVVIDEAQLAAIALLARYSGRTLDAYRHDLRGFFQWAADNELAVLAATRPHIELYRSWMEERGLAARTIDLAIGNAMTAQSCGDETASA